MNALIAVISICAATVAQADCTPDTALDVLQVPAPSLYACMIAGQLAPAEYGQLQDGRYARVRCKARTS